MKFLFATTEVDKLPVTVLSRCQRFDLRRIPAELLAEHFAGICAREGVEAEPEALAIVARAAEGSVRDGLSILDQAIAHADMAAGGGAARVTSAQLREMLGLADKSAQRELFAALLAGDAAAMLDLVAGQFALGADPLALIRSAMEITHRVTVAQIGRGDISAISAEERQGIEGWARALSAGQLHRLWQLLLKGFDEVKSAPDPLVAAEMALLRCLHAAEMPDPGQLVRRLEELAARAPLAGHAGEAQAPAAAPAMGWAALVERVEHHSIPDGAMLREQVRVVELAPGRLVYALAPRYRDDITAALRAALGKATGDNWEVERRAEGGEPSLNEAAEAVRAEADQAMRASPLVAAALAAFPGAEFVAEDHSAATQRRQNWSR